MKSFFFFGGRKIKKCLPMTDDPLQKKVNCTACGKQVNQFQRNSVYEHPALKVLICKVGTFIKFTSNIFPCPPL